MTARGQWLPRLYGGQAPPREGRAAMMRERPGCVNYIQSRERLLSRKSGALSGVRRAWSVEGAGPGGVAGYHCGCFQTPWSI